MGSFRGEGPMQNKRKQRRETTTWPGRIAFERGISKDGARLTLANPRALPDEFELLILTTGEIFQAVAKWRRGRELGVYFVEKDDFLAWPAHGVGPSAA